MKQIIRITFGLTISCLVAAFLMGGVFILTAKAKKHNEHQNTQTTMLGLLGYGKTGSDPSELKLHNIYRYVIEDRQGKSLGYLVSVEREGKTGYQLLVITLDGQFKGVYDIPISADKVMDPPERDTALKTVLGPPTLCTFAEEIIIAMKGEKRMAYLLPGEFQGFKTFIKIMLAVDPSYQILGLEIMEHEEDPGLGGEIIQDYFKNQFKNKSFNKVKDLKVIKDPLPEEFRAFLEWNAGEKGMLSETDLAATRNKYLDQDIYAITGATISSKAVTDGVKGMIKRFAKRIEVLDSVVEGQKIKVTF